MEIRIAQEEDVPYLLDIYNYEVLHGEATFDINPRTLSERLDWPVPLSCEGGLCGYRGTVCLRPQGLPEARNCQEADSAYTEPGEGG